MCYELSFYVVVRMSGSVTPAMLDTVSQKLVNTDDIMDLAAELSMDSSDIAEVHAMIERTRSGTSVVDVAEKTLWKWARSCSPTCLALYQALVALGRSDVANLLKRLVKAGM